MAIFRGKIYTLKVPGGIMVRIRSASGHFITSFNKPLYPNILNIIKFKKKDGLASPRNIVNRV